MFELETADQAKLDEAIRNAESKLPETNTDPILQFKSQTGEHGTWLLGQESHIVDGQHALLLTNSIMRGFQAFEALTEDEKRKRKAEFLGEVMEPLFSNRRANANELPSPASVSPKTTAKMYLSEMEIQVMFRGASVGSEIACEELIGQILAKMRSGEKVYLNPLVKLGKGKFKSGWGEKNRPAFTIVAWCDVAGNQQEEKKTLGNRL